MSDLFGKVLGTILNKSKGSVAPSTSSGGISSDMLGGLLSRVLGKDGSGINSIVKRLAANGLNKIVKSWIAKGPNHLITADEIKQGLGSEQITELATKFGIPEDQVASLLAEHLPNVVDQMTPEGELNDVIDLTPKS